ncbi:MAG: 23S rRNA (adenine(1618)-N(6))-methyltransferase RlmF [Candidatus Dactylopiibacterium sp.]|nr:23S rRNA (adenine(1618)-N(6))-methyltransferase RlmF [Candidatus Dactylopiibacterium sp.]
MSSTASRPAPSAKPGLHPRSLHRQPYDFVALSAAHPALAAFVHTVRSGEASIDFADPAAVRALNAALLAHHYGIRHWSLPPGYLCPPIPGRADYLHVLADLLAEDNAGQIPRGPAVRGLDVGTGANAIYPLLGQALHGWRFLATELDTGAIRHARALLTAHEHSPGALELRAQTHADDVLANTLRRDERLDFTLCNPPFHASAEQAAAGSLRKRRNLGLARPDVAELNFAGRHHELWCEGGERAFIARMIAQSLPLAGHVLWFSTLVSQRDALTGVLRNLARHDAAAVRVLEMAQGQKRSRAVAWSFHDAAARRAWARQHWQGDAK